MSKRRRRIITLIITETWTISWTGQATPAAVGSPIPDRSIVEPPAVFAYDQHIEWQMILQWHIEETVCDG